MHQVSRHWARLAAIVAVFVLVIPILTAGTAAQDGGKVLRVRQITYPDVVDPQKSSFTNEIAIMALAYEGLTRLDANQETIPAAAESWEYNEDATQITFQIRPDLTYSDGSPLSAENFRYAVERTCDPITAGGYQSILFEVVGCAEFAGLGLDADGNPREWTDEEYEEARAAIGATVVDDLTLQLDLTQPAPYYHTVAYTWVFYPVKQEIVAADPDNWWQTAENHIGNGPFTVTGIAQDQQWTFEANENYWQGRPLLDGIEYVYVEDSAVALEAYRAGDLDIVDIDSVQIPEVTSDPELSEDYLTYPTAWTSDLEFNLTQEPFTDKKVREAFSHGFDRETYCTVVRSGDCVPTLSWIPQGLPGSVETDQFGYDLEAGQQALADSSYGSAEALPPISLFYNSDDPAATPRAEFVAGMYRDGLGIEITLEPTDGTTLIALRKEPTTHPQALLVGGWIQDYPDPQNWLSVYWTCDADFAGRISYCNEEFDRLAELGDTTIDPDERLAYYEQAHQVLIDDVPAPFLYNNAATFVINPAFTGYTPTATEVEWPGYLSSVMTIDLVEE